MSGARMAVMIALVVVGGMLIATPTTEATDDQFRYKFPCEPQDVCWLTNDAHGGAYDFVVGPPGGEAADVRAVSEGTFVRYDSQANECTWETSPNDPNAGKHAIVNDIHGRTVIYAHLAAFGSFQPGQRVMQGDSIGLQGNTGRTVNCAEHLHLGGVVGAGYFDGVDEDTLEHVDPHQQYTSTNSVIGDITSPGAAIRDSYIASGGWGNVGRTAARSGTEAGCPATFPLCALYVHYVPHPAEGHWGSRMEFRRHPTDGYGAIMAGRWNIDEAFWVWVPFYNKWRAGGQSPTGTVHNIGIPLMNRTAADPFLCGAPCLAYQRFHVGYIRETEADGVQAFFCPDVYPAYPGQDYSVTVSDIGAVVQAFGETDDPEPWEPWADAWYDIDGDGGVVGNDISAVVAAFGALCYGG